MERRADHSTLSGLHYRAFETHWRVVNGHIDTVRKVMEVERSAPTPALVEHLLSGGSELRRIGELGNALSSKIERFDHSLECLRQHMDVNVLCNVRSIDDNPLEHLENTLKDRLNWLVLYQAAVESLGECAPA